MLKTLFYNNKNSSLRKKLLPQEAANNYYKLINFCMMSDEKLLRSRSLEKKRNFLKLLALFLF
jgi:hypothetical protein